MRKYSIRACLIVPVLIAGWASASATDLPPPPTHSAERALLVKKAGRTLPMRIAAAEWSPIPTGWHRYAAFPIVLGIAY